MATAGKPCWGSAVGGGSALTSPGSCGMRMGGAWAGALPLEAPHYPEYLGSPQAISDCPSGLSSGSPSPRKSSRTPSLGMVLSHLPFPLVGPHSQSSAPRFTHSPTPMRQGLLVSLTVDSWRQRPLQIPLCAQAQRAARLAAGSSYFLRGWDICWSMG